MNRALHQEDRYDERRDALSSRGHLSGSLSLSFACSCSCSAILVCLLWCENRYHEIAKPLAKFFFEIAWRLVFVCPITKSLNC